MAEDATLSGKGSRSLAAKCVTEDTFTLTLLVGTHSTLTKMIRFIEKVSSV
jgi:hypothetical protein